MTVLPAAATHWISSVRLPASRHSRARAPASCSRMAAVSSARPSGLPVQRAMREITSAPKARWAFSSPRAPNRSPVDRS